MKSKYTIKIIINKFKHLLIIVIIQIKNSSYYKFIILLIITLFNGEISMLIKR